MKRMIVWSQLLDSTRSTSAFIIEDETHNYYHLYIHWDKDSISRCIDDSTLAIYDERLVLHPTNNELSGYTLTPLTTEELATAFIRSK